MAKKPQKGKFKYNLQSVLKVREIRETQEKEKFADAQKKLEEEKRKEEIVKNKYSSAQGALRDEFESEDINFSHVFLRQNQIENLKVEVDEQKQATIKAEEDKEVQRNYLVEAVKDRQIIEKDRENKKTEWSAFMKKEENKFLDEVAGIRFNRSME